MFVKSGSVIATTDRDHDRIAPEMLQRLRLRVFGPARSVDLDFGKYGRLRIPRLGGRTAGRTGSFRWTVERASS
jgi:hypothetical protein